jgi:DedD protein
MDKMLQKRVVGAIVLVALGVIFIPALLDGSGYKSRHQKAVEIPPKPSFPSVDQLSVKPVPTPVDEIKKTIKKKKKANTARPIQAWALQVGTFDNKNNAVAFRDKLRKKKHTAYVEATKVDGKETFRVRIGPELNKDWLEKVRDMLKKDQQIDGFIVSTLSK